MVGELHTVRVSMGLQTSTYNNKAEISDRSSPHVIDRTLDLPTLKVFPTYQASIDVDVGERDGAEFLKVKIQDTPDGQTPQESEKENKLILASIISYIHLLPVYSVKVWAMATSLVFYNTSSSYFG